MTTAKKKIGYDDTQDPELDPSLEARRYLPAVLKAVEGASTEALKHVIGSLQGLVYGTETPTLGAPRPTSRSDAPRVHAPGVASDFPDFFNGAKANSNPDQALVAGYWLSVVQDQKFSSGDVNKLLKTVSVSLQNPSRVFTTLRRRKPAVLFKDGERGPAHLYRLTKEGIAAVENMLPS